MLLCFAYRICTIMNLNTIQTYFLNIIIFFLIIVILKFKYISKNYKNNKTRNNAVHGFETTAKRNECSELNDILIL